MILKSRKTVRVLKLTKFVFVFFLFSCSSAPPNKGEFTFKCGFQFYDCYEKAKEICAEHELLSVYSANDTTTVKIFCK